MWTVAEPVVREWIERNLGPAGTAANTRREGAIEVGRFLVEVPKLLARGAVLVEQLDAITRNGLMLAPETVAGDRPRGSTAQPLDHGGALGHRGAAGMADLSAGLAPQRGHAGRS